MRHVISVDLGGTWIRAALVSADGVCDAIVRAPTHCRRLPEAIINDLMSVIEKSRRRAADTQNAIEAVAIGIPTTLDPKGCAASSDNLPTMAGYDIKKQLEITLHLPIVLFNDADCFTVGEWWQGVGQGTRNFCGITLGTGIGAGLVINGNLYNGSHGYAGEIWNSPWITGRVEQYACGQAVESEYERRSGQRLNGIQIAELAEQGDSTAMNVYADFGTSLGQILSFIINMIDPEAIAVGGAVAESFKFFRDTLRQTISANTTTGVNFRVEQSRLGEKAALIGASKLFWERELIR